MPTKTIEVKFIARDFRNMNYMDGQICPLKKALNRHFNWNPAIRKTRVTSFGKTPYRNVIIRPIALYINGKLSGTTKRIRLGKIAGPHFVWSMSEAEWLEHLVAVGKFKSAKLRMKFEPK